MWAATVYSAIRSAAAAVSASGGISATMIVVAAARTTPNTMTGLPRRQASGMRHPAAASHHQGVSAPARPSAGPTVTAARTSGTARSARAGWRPAHATALQTPCCRRPRYPGSGGMSHLFPCTAGNGGHADAGPADGTRVDDTEAGGKPPVDAGEPWRQEEREQVAEGWGRHDSRGHRRAGRTARAVARLRAAQEPVGRDVCSALLALAVAAGGEPSERFLSVGQ